MKKIFLILLIIATFSIPSPKVYSLDILQTIITGISSMDIFLNELARRGETSSQVTHVVYEIDNTFGMGIPLINSLYSRGYNYGEIYYLGLLSHSCHKPIEYIITQRRQHPGIGWGVLAQRLGVHPSVLNKKRVALVRQYKEKNIRVIESDSSVSTKPSKTKNSSVEKSKNSSVEIGKGKNEKNPHFKEDKKSSTSQKTKVKGNSGKDKSSVHGGSHGKSKKK